MRRLLLSIAIPPLLLLMGQVPAAAAPSSEQRFPPPDFRSGYELPAVQTAPGRDLVWAWIDLGALAAALSLAAWAAVRRRSRRLMLALSVAAVAYFGFYRKGCVCPVGSVQNVALAGFGDYALPWVVAAFFLMPLLFTLLFGRVFCASVCPLGAIQDLALIESIEVPRWLESALALAAWAYLGLAILFAATGSDFIICRYDPFVGFFRLSATPQMLLLGAVLLVTGMFVGRVYCRFLCPYGVILRWLSPLSWRRVSISPTQCIDCRLCERSCPFGAIRQPSRRPPGSPSGRDRARLAFMLLLTPILMAAGAWLGYRSAPAMSRLHPDVRLAQIISTTERQPAEPLPDEVKAFRGRDRTPEQLYAQAGTIQRRFAIATPFFGGFMGLAVGLKLAAHSLRRGSSEYLADPGACVACARCFRTCPVEQERLAGRAVTIQQ